jgi:hypothetical protein
MNCIIRPTTDHLIIAGVWKQGGIDHYFLRRNQLCNAIHQNSKVNEHVSCQTTQSIDPPLLQQVDTMSMTPLRILYQ